MSEENTTQAAENSVQDAAQPSNYNAANIQVLEGMEAVRKIYVENFPAFIIVDDKGNDFFADFAH